MDWKCIGLKSNQIHWNQRRWGMNKTLCGQFIEIEGDNANQRLFWGTSILETQRSLVLPQHFPLQKTAFHMNQIKQSI